MFFSDRVPPKARHAYTKDAASGMMGAVMQGMTLPFFGVIARDTLDASALEISILTMAPVAANFFSIFWASQMEGRPKMPFATTSWIVARSLLFLAVFVTTSVQFTVMVALFWLAASVAGPAYSALMKEIYPDSDRARIMGYARICTLGVLMLVTAVAGPLLGGYAYRVIFPIAAVFGVAAVFIFKKIPSSETTGGEHRSLLKFAASLWEIQVRDKGFRWFCAGIFVSGFANLMVGPLYTIYQVDVLGVNTTWAAFYSVLAQATGMAGYFYWGSFIDRKTSHRAIAICALLLAVTPLSYIVITKAWMLLPVMFLAGFVNSGIDLGYMNGILQYAPSEKITHYQSLFAMQMAARGMVAPFVGVLLQRWGMSFNQLFALAAAMILVSYLVQMAGIRKHDEHVSVAPA